MPNEPDNNATEPLVPGLTPTEAPGVTTDRSQDSGGQAASPPDPDSVPRSRLLPAGAWSGHRPGAFVGLVALAALLAVALVAGVVLQATAAQRLMSAVGLRIQENDRHQERLFKGQRRERGPRPDRDGRGRADGPGGPMSPMGPLTGLPGLGQAEHGDVSIGGGNGAAPTTVRFVRGQVTAVSPTSITVKSTDGFSGDFVVNADTKVRSPMRRGRGQSPVPPGSDISAVKVGDSVTAIGTVAGNTVTATTLMLMGADPRSASTPSPTGPAT